MINFLKKKAGAFWPLLRSKLKGVTLHVDEAAGTFTIEHQGEKQTCTFKQLIQEFDEL